MHNQDLREKSIRGVLPPPTNNRLFSKSLKRCFVAAGCCLFSISVWAQSDQRITLNLQKASLEQVIWEIQKKTGFTFMYGSNDIQAVNNITLNEKDKSIREILDKCLKGTNLTYEISGKEIIIKQTDANKKRTIKGVVVDKDGMPLPGASVRLKGTDTVSGTNLDGEFQIAVSGNAPTLVFSFIGTETQEVAVGKQNELKITLLENVRALDDVVVTGYYTQRKQTFTGAAVNYSGEELAAISNKNVLSTLSSLDPSFKLVDNLSLGSNPNAVPNVQVRGMNSLPDASGSNLSETYKGSANLPTFILDGFEVDVEKVYDLDPNRIQNISILKDASATAIYGSRAANGVVIIDTKAPAFGKLQLNYYGSVSAEVADLSDYHLLNASEKLRYEQLAGLYSGSNATYVEEMYRQDYNDRLKLVQRGVDTDWLALPLKSTGISNQHSIQLEGGNENFRYGVDLTYNMTDGVMKGSDRTKLGTSIKLQYNYKNLRFRNEITYDKVTSNNSPYGSFSQYALMNPYYYPYDENGQVKQIVFESSNANSSQTAVSNPLYNATLNTKDQTTYDDFVDNFSVEWNILPNLKFKGQFSIERINRYSDIFKPADHTDFVNQEENKGSYQKGNTVSESYDGSAVLSYFNYWKKHALSVNAGWNITSEDEDYSSYTIYGFPNQQLDHPSLGAGFLEDAGVEGDATISRLMGFFANVNYSYDDRYFVDGSIRLDGSSQFGSEQRWGTFWSAGLGWNIHNEQVFKDSPIVNQLRLRASTGFTGGQNFYPYQALMMYQYNTNLSYQDYIGAVIKAFGNSNLKWQRTQKHNFGVDFAFFNNRLSGYFNYFIENSKDLLVDVDMMSYLGFDSYKENLGETQNKGYEFNVRWSIFQNKDWHVNVFANGQHYTNKLKKISSGLSSYNQQADAEESTAPYVRYAEGASINTIWVVQSAGIDPATGNEVFIKRDGTYTNEWSEQDYVPYASTDPKLSGNFGLNIYWKGWELNTNFFYRFGGYAYNQTLVDKVENVDPFNNVDSRALYDRWQTPGVPAVFKRISDQSVTRPTSRFVEKDNFLSVTSLSLAYTFDRDWVKSFGAQYLKLTFYANDFLQASTMRQERGTDYPYARHFSIAAQVTF